MRNLSLTGKRWSLDEGAGDCGGREVLSHLLERRGLNDERWLPFEAPGSAPPDLALAIERVERACERNERVAIFGDYDCDGITSALQMARCLRRHGLDPHVMLPHRVTDGYGLREAIIERVLRDGISLLLTVDTGVTAAVPLALARERGLDVMIFDHHQCSQELPQVHAIVHPAFATHPGVHASAAGIVFGFVSALEGVVWEDRDTDLALAAIGTIADLVELRGSNRTLAREGIAAINRMREGPIHDLCKEAGCLGPVTSRDVAFRIAPRINAAGRMDDPMVAYRALSGDSDSLRRLHELNALRQQRVEELLREIMEKAGEDSAPFLSYVGEEYPMGVVGLLAGKLTEKFGKPSLVATLSDGICTASARSVPGFDVTQALQSCADLLTTFGGHAQAAGCTFPHGAFPALADRLSRRVEAALPVESLCPTLLLDGSLDLSDISLRLCQDLLRLEPFGQGNREPRFLLEDVRIASPRRIGKEGAHLQCRVGEFKAVGFGLGKTKEHLSQPVDLACRLGIDTWQGTPQPQLFIEDIRFAQMGANFPSMANASVSATPSAEAIL